MKNFRWQLMTNNILPKDKNELIKFIKKSNRFTNGQKVREFENKWSKWLGVKYSTFVNSGASANLISLHILKEIEPKKKEIILPPFTWNSDVVSVINAGFKPVFVDINLENLALNEKIVSKKINKNTAAIFLTHAMGFIGLSKNFLNLIKKKKIFLIEDVCESHGAKLGNKKAGTFGQISNFSFYYAHHMTTIEGGMISTNSKKIDILAKMKRGHGLLRDSQDKSFIKKIKMKNKDLNSDFIFCTEGFNLRNDELSAVIGLEQIKRLDQNIKKRNRNHKFFLKMLDKKIYKTDFLLEGSSNYAFNLVLKKQYKNKVNKLMNLMKRNNIEFRRGSAGGGNQMRQPYIKKLITQKYQDFNEVEYIHKYGFYIGNYPDLSLNAIKNLVNILNKL